MAVLVCYVANFTTCSIRKRMTAEKVVLEMLSILSTLYEDNLELSCMTLCVECGSTNTGWHINVHYVINFSAHTLSVKLIIMGIWEWAIYVLNGWGIYDLLRWGIYDLNGWGIYDLNG